MKTTFSLVCIWGLLSFLPGAKEECIKITCLNPKDTVSGKLTEVRSLFLIESLHDTLTNFDIRSSCGCEYPVWNKGMRIYPGHPDTVIIVSSIKEHSGHWQKQTTISAGSCTKIFYTGPWTIIK